MKLISILRQFANQLRRDATNKAILINVSDDTCACSYNTSIANHNIGYKGASSANPGTATNLLIVNLTLTSAPTMRPHNMTASVEMDIGRDVAIVTNVYRAVPVNREIASNPTILADDSGSAQIHRPNHFCPRANRVTKRVQELSFQFKSIRPSKGAVY